MEVKCASSVDGGADPSNSSIIRPINKAVVHRICSGQVILDLSSAVKELVENSLDAGATSIEISLKEYGEESFQVADNGCGISPQNFQVLALKHHTSKLSDFPDLQSLTTFGFRGEALSSLCSLGDLSIETRTHYETVATHLTFDHSGLLVDQRKTARQVGTTVMVKKLFSTLPVRSKQFQRNIRKEYGKLITLLNDAGEIAAAMAEAKEETNGFDEKTEEAMLELAKLKEEIGAAAFHRLFVTNMVYMHEKATGGDDFLFWMEENGLESAKRVNALNAKLCTFHGECAKFAVEWCLNKVLAGAGAEVDIETVFAKLGFFSEDRTVLFDECAKSAAELSIKKMRFGSLVDKLDKRTILKNEIDEAKKMRKELVGITMASKLNLMVKELTRREQDSQAYAIVKEKDAGGAVISDKPTEISRSKFKNMECSLCNEKVRNIDGVKRASAFATESIRVLVEMMKGVKFGQQLASGVDEAIALADEWTDAMAGKYVTKLLVEVLVDKHSLFEVLKREIAENWKMEKEVKDRLIIYQRKHAHIAQGFATDIVEEGITKVGALVEGDETIKEKNSGVGTVLEGDETIEEKNSTVVGGDETIEGKNSGVGTVVDGDETIEVKKSEGGTPGEGDLTKHPIDYHGLVWKKVGLFAAVGMIAALAELAMGKTKKSIATMSGGEETKEDTEAKEEVTEQRICRLAKLKEHIGVVSLKRLFNQEDDSSLGFFQLFGLISIFFLLVALLLVWFH